MRTINCPMRPINCPICGAEPYAVATDYGRLVSFGCRCGLLGPPTEIGIRGAFYAREAAIKKWNDAVASMAQRATQP